MAIFQIKVSYISRRQKNKTTKGKAGKNLSYISRGTSGSGRAKKSLLYIAREDEYSDRDDLKKKIYRKNLKTARILLIQWKKIQGVMQGS